jgi:hypothetical protein
MSDLEQALTKYLADGRAYNAQNYQVTAGFMREIFDRILSDRGKINRYKEMLQIERIRDQK